MHLVKVIVLCLNPESVVKQILGIEMIPAIFL